MTISQPIDSRKVLNLCPSALWQSRVGNSSDELEEMWSVECGLVKEGNIDHSIMMSCK